VTTSKFNWITGVQALHGNPYDGHTLKDAINRMEKIIIRRMFKFIFPIKAERI
ncbi:hypothetical protein LEP1GSC169_1902, partial [Leptospira santarosai str. HAI1349]